MPARQLTADDYWLFIALLIAASGWTPFNEYERVHPQQFSWMASAAIYLGITAAAVGITAILRKVCAWAVTRVRSHNHSWFGSE